MVWHDRESMQIVESELSVARKYPVNFIINIDIIPHYYIRGRMRRTARIGCATNWVCHGKTAEQFRIAGVGGGVVRG